ncbi:ribonuclease [Rossellomorea vietnamensis]|uniref:Ribonuclease n=1 Tax=Rossellomorea vietnamensis TaxID=218284 RepID=A0A5D4MFA9_9BACI|nr:YlzJ-like family protein [Rossellomorea vietnamensis]TYS00188.1 ribonuclease [Rossellomorea vietnamensis]
MILYTTVPQEMIFPAEESTYSQQMVIEWQGIPLLVEQSEQQYRVVRVMSSNPDHYLNDQICPGQYLQM